MQTTKSFHPRSMEDAVQFLKGIGPRRAGMLAAPGIRTLADLLATLPFRYEDRTRFCPIASLREGEWALVRGEVCGVGGFDARRRGVSVFEVLVRDGSGGLRVKFFNQPYLRRLVEVGRCLVLYGQVRKDAYAHQAPVLMNPECEILEEDPGGASVHSGRVVPIYRRVGELRTRALRKILHALASDLPSDIPDAIPGYLARQLRLMPKAKAIGQLHFPGLRGASPQERSKELDLLNAGMSPAHKRFIFEELFQLQVAIRMSREQRVRHVKHRKFGLG